MAHISTHPLSGTSFEMKVFLILWALGLACCDKLERTYLPPPGSITSGGHHKDLDLPFEFPKGAYHSPLEPENYRNVVNDVLRPNYPTIAIGIDRQGPSVTSTRLGTSTLYNFAPTTATTPIQSNEVTVGPGSNQGFSSKISSFHRNLNYPEENVITNDPRLSSIPFDSKISGVLPQTAYAGKSSTYSDDFPDLHSANNPQIQHDLASGFVNGHGDPIYSNITPTQYGSNVDSTSRVPFGTANTAPDKYYDQENLNSSKAKSQQPYMEGPYYSTPQSFKNFNVENSSYAPTNRDATSTFIPIEYTEGISSTPGLIESSSEYSPTPEYSPEILRSNYNTQIQSERDLAAADRNAVIINYENILTPDGFAYSYDTSNGIHADENGTVKNGVKAQGSYSYIGDDGQVYRIVYTADENGFLPHGDHLPTAPPIPNAILKVIEEAEKNKRLGIIDDGKYDDSKYGHERYQSILERKPQIEFSSINRKRPINTGIILNNTTISSEKEGIPANNKKDSNPAYSNDKVGIISERPYYSIADNINRKNYYDDDKGNQFSSSNVDQPNESGLLRSGKIKTNDKQFDTRPVGKITENSEIIYGSPGVHSPDYYKANNLKTGGISSFKKESDNENKDLPSNAYGHTAKEQVTSYNTEYDTNTNLLAHSGYEYNRPQQTFNNNYENTFQSAVSNPSEETERIKADYIRKPQVIFQQNYINGTIQPGLQKFYNTVSDKSKDKPPVATDKILHTTSTPEYGSTSYNYQYPYTSKVTGNVRGNDYPISTLRSQYTPPTTPMPSEFSSRLPPSTIGFEYSSTTPVTSQFVSTIRPSVASKIFGSSTRRPAYTVSSKYERRPDNDNLVSTMNPDDTFDRINGKPRYRGRPNIEVTVNERPKFIQEAPQVSSIEDGTISDLGISDYRSQNTGPKNYRGESSTEKAIGEDFDGPKQAQRFGSEHGYYY